MTQSLYRRMLGPSFASLPAKVQALHDIGDGAAWKGYANVERGASLIARAICTMTALPPTATDVPLTVTFTPQADGEIWRRQFGNHLFVSHQRPGDGVVLERVGPVTLHLQPSVTAEGLSLTLLDVALAGLRLPRGLLPRISTREYECAGRYTFQVQAELPGVGRLVRYEGWLERA